MVNPIRLPRPMKAVSGELPTGDGWAFEVKWDGMRVLAALEEGVTRLVNGRGTDVTVRFPELAPLAEPLAAHQVGLDGEVVVLTEEGRSDFGRMQHRMHLADAARAARGAQTEPVHYVAFDLVHLDGHDLVDLPYEDRRRLLLQLVEPAPSVLVPDHHVGEGASLLAAATERGLEGLVAKRLSSRYEPGRRSPVWRKIKVRRRQEFVVGGWTPGEGNRTGGLGALLVGYHDPEAPAGLRFAGAVGTGFAEPERARLQRRLDDLDGPCPFVGPIPPLVARVARWVEPALVAEVAFGEWTADGRLRHPSYLGLRADKDPADVVREPG